MDYDDWKKDDQEVFGVVEGERDRLLAYIKWRRLDIETRQRSKKDL